MSERTFSIVKPDAVKKGDAGAILAEIVKAGFKIVSIKKISISKAQAEGFYHVHSLGAAVLWRADGVHELGADCSDGAGEGQRDRRSA